MYVTISMFPSKFFFINLFVFLSLYTWLLLNAESSKRKGVKTTTTTTGCVFLSLNYDDQALSKVIFVKRWLTVLSYDLIFVLIL